ncbi:unnamed protein product, partial [marine sediment metagenome]
MTFIDRTETFVKPNVAEDDAKKELYCAKTQHSENKDDDFARFMRENGLDGATSAHDVPAEAVGQAKQQPAERNNDHRLANAIVRDRDIDLVTLFMAAVKAYRGADGALNRRHAQDVYSISQRVFDRSNKLLQDRGYTERWQPKIGGK